VKGCREGRCGGEPQLCRDAHRGLSTPSTLKNWYLSTACGGGA